MDFLDYPADRCTDNRDRIGGSHDSAGKALAAIGSRGRRLARGTGCGKRRLGLYARALDLLFAQVDLIRRRGLCQRRRAERDQQGSRQRHEIAIQANEVSLTAGVLH